MLTVGRFGARKRVTDHLLAALNLSVHHNIKPPRLVRRSGATSLTTTSVLDRICHGELASGAFINVLLLESAEGWKRADVNHLPAAYLTPSRWRHFAELLHPAPLRRTLATGHPGEHVAAS